MFHVEFADICTTSADDCMNLRLERTEMGRNYEHNDGAGTRRLLSIDCDESECRASIKPGPGIIGSGWIKISKREFGDSFTWAYCPDHAGDALSGWRLRYLGDSYSLVGLGREERIVYHNDEEAGDGQHGSDREDQ